MSRPRVPHLQNGGRSGASLMDLLGELNEASKFKALNTYYVNVILGVR